MTFLNGLFSVTLARASVLGVFGAISLALMVTYSRRGPLIYPVYAAILASLAMLLARDPTLTYGMRFDAALGGFAVSSFGLYVAVVLSARRSRRALVRAGRLPPSALNHHVSIVGHAWRIGLLLGVGAVASAGVAFISM